MFSSHSYAFSCAPTCTCHLWPSNFTPRPPAHSSSVPSHEQGTLFGSTRGGCKSFPMRKWIATTAVARVNRHVSQAALAKRTCRHESSRSHRSCSSCIIAFLLKKKNPTVWNVIGRFCSAPTTTLYLTTCACLFFLGVAAY